MRCLDLFVSLDAYIGVVYMRVCVDIVCGHVLMPCIYNMLYVGMCWYWVIAYVDTMWVCMIISLYVLCCIVSVHVYYMMMYHEHIWCVCVDTCFFMVIKSLFYEMSLQWILPVFIAKGWSLNVYGSGCTGGSTSVKLLFPNMNLPRNLVATCFAFSINDHLYFVWLVGWFVFSMSCVG